MAFGRLKHLELAIRLHLLKNSELHLYMYKNHLIIGLLLFLFSCGGDRDSNPTQGNEEEQELEPISFANCLVDTSSRNLEIATWNIEQFPKLEETADIEANDCHII